MCTRRQRTGRRAGERSARKAASRPDSGTIGTAAPHPQLRRQPVRNLLATQQPGAMARARRGTRPGSGRRRLGAGGEVQWCQGLDLGRPGCRYLAAVRGQAAGQAGHRQQLAHRHLPKLSRTNFLAPIHSWWLWAPCASWRVATVNRYTGPWNEQPRRTRSSCSPTATTSLIAIQNARTVSRRLGNAVLVTNNGYGHITDSDRSACISRVVTRYLTTLRTPRRGTVCQPDHIPFEPGFGE